MKPGLLACACLCALLSPTLSFAQDSASEARPPVRPLVGGHGNNLKAFIAQHDDNADGRLTWEEFEAFRRKRFDATDANGDGSVDVEEYVQEFADRSRDELERTRDAQGEQTRRRFASMDADKDGKLSRAEFDASGERVWTQGQKAVAEAGKPAATGEEAKTEAAAARFDRSRDRLGMPTSHTAEGFAALFDGNSDGRVDREEFDAARDNQFSRTDANGDGMLDADEYLAEFEDRVDRRIATLVEGSDRQTRVRFAAMDTDKDGRMSFAEYQASGRRTFDAADRSKDGVVDEADMKLPPPPRPQRAAGARNTGN